MNCAFPIPSPIAALASSGPGRLRVAELSVVSIFDGEIGDPVTWIDEPGSSGPDGCSSARAARPFQAVAQDIGAHLPTGTVLVRRPDSAVGLLRRILPEWRPTLVLDTTHLAACAQWTAGLHHRAGRLAAGPTLEAGLGATADRAVAAARSLLLLIGALENGRVGSGIEQEEYAHHFL